MLQICRAGLSVGEKRSRWEAVDFNALLRRGVRETLAADLGTDTSEMQQPTDEKLAVTPCRTGRKGYGHWEPSLAVVTTPPAEAGGF